MEESLLSKRDLTHFPNFQRQTFFLGEVVLVVKNPPTNAGDRFHHYVGTTSLEKGIATHSGILAWRIPWTEKPGSLQSMGHKESDTNEQLTLPLFEELCLHNHDMRQQVMLEGCSWVFVLLCTVLCCVVFNWSIIALWDASFCLCESALCIKYTPSLMSPLPAPILPSRSSQGTGLRPRATEQLPTSLLLYMSQLLSQFLPPSLSPASTSPLVLFF